MTTLHTGGCLCGQVRFRIAAEAGPSRYCWCRDCQRLAGNGTANVIFPSAAIEITGQVAQYVKPADSGNQVTRRFCPQCGTQLFSDSSGRPGLTVVRLGTLDEPSSVRPAAHIWAASAPRWASLDPALARFEHAPPAAPSAPPTGAA
ncbi:MAG: GFA family protein [Burkholderiales bacterium]